MKNLNYRFTLFSLLLGFFVMGFVDLCGVATSHLKDSFNLSDTESNIFPSMVFLWFFIFSIPSGILMSKIGRLKTVKISIFITIVALFIPIFNYTYLSMLICFALIGIGNTIIQVSLNPLLANFVPKNKVASSLTFGQFVKAIASFSAPLLIGYFVRNQMSWTQLFPVFLVFAFLSKLLLQFVKIPENLKEMEPSSFKETISQLKDSKILLLFFGIASHVGLDVGINIIGPKFLMERTSIGLEDAGIATIIYFIFRTAGCLLGSQILAKVSSTKIFTISAFAMLCSIIGLMFSYSTNMIYLMIAIFGLANSNIFPIILSKSLQYKPSKQNEVSGLMIMGIVGGAIFPIIMGIFSDLMRSQTGSLIVLGIAAIYLCIISSNLKKFN